MTRVRLLSACTGAALLLALLVPAVLAPGCGTGSESSSRTSAPRGGATVTGTAIDAETGRVLAGVRIEGPGGTSAVSDKEGRFELRLSPGDHGRVTGKLGDGRRGAITLQPLAPGRLETVLRLERP